MSSESSSSLDRIAIEAVDKTVVCEPVKELEATENYKVISSRDADVTLRFLEEHDAHVEPISPERERKLSRKVVWIIVPLTMFINMVLYADKAAMSFAAIFTFFEDTGLTQNKYNNANTLFYVGFVLGQSNLYFLQKFPVGKVVTVMTALWCIIMFLHCAAYNPSGVYALRFFLGFVEAIGVPVLNITMGQFLTAEEKAATAPVFYASCMGVAIPIGFIAYGVLHIASTSIANWKIFSIIIGCITFITSALVILLYPNNPTDAKFLTTEEKVWVIRRVQQTTGSSIEQKQFKKHQVKETLLDPITWLFGGFFLLQQLANNLAYQQNLLFESLGGITNLDATLVSVAAGGYNVICALLATWWLMWKKDTTAYSVVFWSIPSLVGCIGSVAMSWDNSIGILAMICLATPFGVPWIMMFSWNVTSCSGYTKKLTRSAVVMFFYGIANIISPQLWQQSTAPRYKPAWIVQIVCSFFTAPLLALVIRHILSKRNKERLAVIAAQEDTEVGVVERDGEKVKVNLAMMDLTDLENERFVYPL
ncbi:LANO_0A00628g1_1 [Lachancea nothofagi CBS 11611]|uniref:LANO_0A00628g1_1 n=1 Tax=Lachancea nothofagi CBS 11611 TaxID=1266666 RepID=A0A1G4ILS1_9SACH|nr:LANO_0A00628g1_1 [Lachancea nothofagi CBS 11611]